ncbi:hypothetical protein HQ590_10905, partial [bacterium]|nr:hypothetical protein [bacterium]
MKTDPTGYNTAARRQMTRLGVNFSTSRELIAAAEGLKPALQFRAKTPAQWRAWRQRFLAALRPALGRPLPRVTPTPRVVEKTDAGDHWRLKIVYRTTPRMWAPAYLLIPKEVAKSRRQVPAV